MNLGEEYITGGRRFESWRDTNVRIKGELVLHYLAIFVTDWLNSGGKQDFKMDDIEEVIEEHKNLRNESPYIMQVSSSGPDTIWTTLKYTYSKLITSAKKEILIQSPYFIPDTSLVSQV